jgi:hypothetical protein
MTLSLFFMLLAIMAHSAFLSDSRYVNHNVELVMFIAFINLASLFMVLGR